MLVERIKDTLLPPLTEGTRDDRIRNAALLLTVAMYCVGAWLGVAALAVVFLREAILRKWRWVATGLDGPLVALALAIAVSTLATEWRRESLIAAISFFLTVQISIPTVARFVRTGVDRVVIFLLTWVGGGIAAAAWALGESLWRGFATPPVAALGQNALGTTLVSALILALGLLAGGVLRGRWLWVAIPIMLAGLTATMSRAAWLALPAGVATLMLMGTGARARLALACGTAAVVVLIAAARPTWPSLDTKIRSIGSLEANRSTRILLWSTVPRMVADHPWFGVGYGTFRLAFMRYRPADASDREPPTAHNIFLNYAAETGALGLAAIVAVWAVGVASTWRWLVRSPIGSTERAAATAVLATLVGFLINQLFDGTALTPHVGFGLLALLAIGATGERYLRPVA